MSESRGLYGELGLVFSAISVLIAFQINFDDMQMTGMPQASSSIGRAAVSKTAGWGFASLLACHLAGSLSLYADKKLMFEAINV